ncbi:MAG: histidine kinase, partial [Ferruginibacter sp.]|nr:histidine kinase [Ferruginibacter sp.]
QSPAYFDYIKNKFTNAKEDNLLAKVTGTNILNVTPLLNGGVMYSNENGSHFFENEKFNHFKYAKDGVNSGIVIEKPSASEFICTGFNKSGFNLTLLHVNDNKLIDSVSISKWIKPDFGILYRVHENKFYISNTQTGNYYIFSNFQINPIRFKVDTININEPIFWTGFTPTYFNVLSKNGTIHIFNKKTLQPLFKLSGNYSPKSLLNDSKQNIWVGTVDKGLLLYKKKNISTIASPDNFTNNSYLSIAKKPNGSLFAGNLKGQVIETDGKYFIAHQLYTTNKTEWQRKLIVSQNKVFSFSEGGDFINFTKKLVKQDGFQLSTKTATILNDSIIIAGNYGALYKLNTTNETITPLPSLKKRVTALTTMQSNIIYHGSTDGLYRYDYNAKKDSSLTNNNPLFAQRVTALGSTPDNYVWVGTPDNGIYVLHNDSVMFSFTAKDGLISNSVNCIASGKLGEVWIGTNSGITILKYAKNIANIKYQNLSINDGLSSNIVNDMVYSNDIMYCATGNGICTVPAAIQLAPFDIAVQLISVNINGVDTAIASTYHLKHNQNNIALQFAGIELGGHFAYFKYRINNGIWQVLNEHTLNLQLNNGTHTLEIVAVDVNGNTGTKPLHLSFKIATPFWKALWFWMVISLLSGIFLFRMLRKRELVKKERELQALLYQKKLTELELQALKAQINPHFIFNSLNSIKLLSHQGKHSEAENYLDKFANLLRSAMEQSALQQITLKQEIDFIHNYLSLEQLRFPNKLSFTIETDKNINTNEVLIPSMLLQPYVENAVKHGVALLKNNTGLVQVKFYKKNNNLIAEVQDNGNGISVNYENTKRKGIGMENTNRRSTLYNIETKIVNLKLENKDQSGTLIQLIIPH